jgi:hypothetical protein
MWKKCNTPLRVKVTDTGERREFDASIFSVDPVASHVGLVLGVNKYDALDVSGAEFVVDATRVSATKQGSVWLVFDELSIVPAAKM